MTKFEEKVSPQMIESESGGRYRTLGFVGSCLFAWLSHKSHKAGATSERNNLGSLLAKGPCPYHQTCGMMKSHLLCTLLGFRLGPVTNDKFKTNMKV